MSSREDVERMEQQRKQQEVKRQYQHAQVADGGQGADQQNSPETSKPVIRSSPKVGRNSPCPVAQVKNINNVAVKFDYTMSTN